MIEKYVAIPLIQRAVLNSNNFSVYFQSFVEAYDIASDPHQMENLGFDMLPSERTQYSLYLDKLKQCQGDSCHNS